MAAGRLVGDRVIARLGRRPTVGGGGALTALGLGIAVAPSGTPTAGLALVGLGLSCTFPALIAEAVERGRRGGRAARGADGRARREVGLRREKAGPA